MKRFFVLPMAAAGVIFMLGTGVTAYASAETSSFDLSREGSISLTLYSDEAETAVSDGVLTVYKVADPVSNYDGSFSYVYTEDFSGCEASLEDITDATLAVTLADYVSDNGISGTSQEISSDGTLTFAGLGTGLYLIAQTGDSTGYYTIDPFLVTVPQEGEDGWIYDVDASPKVEVYAEPEPAEPENPTPSNPYDGTSGGSSGGSSSGTSGRLPQTGMLVWPIPVLAAAGILLCVAGTVMRRKGKRTHA
ncbi:MAG: hypothetical protein LUC41_08670 [Clostridiales bacterium]|nr:hypothetical protein [Clostridiales bacterium]